MQISYYRDSTVSVFSLFYISLSLCLSLSPFLSVSLSLCLSLLLCFSLSLSMYTPIDREICRSHIMHIVPFLCFHFFTSLPLSLYVCLSLSLPSLCLSLSHSLSLYLCNLLMIVKYADLILCR